MAGRFALYTDADVHGPLVEALSSRGWDVLRAVDPFPEGTDDVVHFERAAQLGRVMVSNDRDVRPTRRFLAAARSSLSRPHRLGAGAVVLRDRRRRLPAVRGVVAHGRPFGQYPILYVKPKSPGRPSWRDMHPISAV